MGDDKSVGSDAKLVAQDRINDRSGNRADRRRDQLRDGQAARIGL